MQTDNIKTIKQTLLERIQAELTSFKAEEIKKTSEEIYEDWEIITFKEILTDAFENYILPFFPEDIISEINNETDILQSFYEDWSQEENPCALSCDDLFDWILAEYAELIINDETPE